MGIQVRLQGEPSACVHEGRMCVSVLRICREKSGSLRDRMALERSALPRPLIATLKALGVVKISPPLLKCFL